ncbi:MAG: carbonic anhydrase family protein [Candidatus Viridilinea halotolerans]|uniref:carbonic anhydrase n=1 Tax=Candidatus Viridilinea halotolerans TaxID=2491704 RepID=A0A426TYB4_9CHLR|nr:MAG: carbonic anhydrase family protein [Candidatus Viridilinea halotolerans]
MLRSFMVRTVGLVLHGLLLINCTRIATARERVPWSYHGDTGPALWGQLCPAYALSACGLEQSPIDIPSDAPLNHTNLSFAYVPAPLAIINSGCTIQVNYAPGSTITLDGTSYTLVQFHFHHRSEHTVDGQHSALELHLVHKSATGALAVVGVLLEEGAEHAAYAPIFQHIPSQPGAAISAPAINIDAAALLPASRAYWHYNGSLTTPPCTEGVSWVVMREPVQISASQIAAFTAAYQNNERPVQAMNHRRFITTPSMLIATMQSIKAKRLCEP